MAAAASAVFIVVAGGGARALSQVNAAWRVFLVPAAIGGALAGAVSARLGRSLGPWSWLLGPASVPWAFGVGFAAGWRPVYCAGMAPWLAAVALLSLGHGGWAAPLALRLERGGWSRVVVLVFVGLPAGVALLAAFYAGWGRSWHGEFACGGGGGG